MTWCFLGGRENINKERDDMEADSYTQYTWHIKPFESKFKLLTEEIPEVYSINIYL